MIWYVTEPPTLTWSFAFVPPLFTREDLEAAVKFFEPLWCVYHVE